MDDVLRAAAEGDVGSGVGGGWWVHSQSLVVSWVSSSVVVVDGVLLLLLGSRGWRISLAWLLVRRNLHDESRSQKRRMMWRRVNMTKDENCDCKTMQRILLERQQGGRW